MASKTHHDELAAWQKLYAELGIVVDLSGLQVPPSRDGFPRLIVVAAGLIIEQVLAACTKKFPVWRWTNDDLDKLTTSKRSSGATYAIWVRDRIEADEEYANKSYNDLQQMSIKGITLVERLLLELKYFSETGQHLDLQNVTLCTGSRYQDWRGQVVPLVRWSDGGLGIGWDSRGSADGGLRARQVVQ